MGTFWQGSCAPCTSLVAQLEVRLKFCIGAEQGMVGSLLIGYNGFMGKELSEVESIGHG